MENINIEDIKKIINDNNKILLEKCSEEYNNFMRDLLNKYNVSLEIKGQFINDKIEIVQYFKLNN